MHLKKTRGINYRNWFGERRPAFLWKIFSVFLIVNFAVFQLAFNPLTNQSDMNFSTQPISFLEAKPTPTPNNPLGIEEIPEVDDSSGLKSNPEIAQDLEYDSFRYHSWDIPNEVSIDSDFWIEIDLTNQMLFAYRNNQLISGFMISSGTESHKTVTGTYKIFSKYPSVGMRGPGYDLTDVPFTMFFYKGYAVHGTYWHNNFGTPMSHGCINMLTSDAAWIYDNAPVGTHIMVHY